MEIGIVDAVNFLVEHKNVSAVLEIATLVAIILMYRSSVAARRRLHSRIDSQRERAEAHEKECAERWGRAEATLSAIEKSVDKCPGQR